MANYNKSMVDSRNDFGKIIKQQRNVLELTLQQLADKSGVSSSHLGRIERGQRFPSAHILRRIAKPLGFEESELFTLAGYLASEPLSIAEKSPPYAGGRLDPYVAGVLSQEPVEVQRAVIGILTLLKNIARSMSR
jgi:transcriptional regulator with XRE-family HTH domain